MHRVKSMLNNWLPPRALSLLFRLRVALLSYSARSYSQEGEDMILRRIFQERTDGFYVDVGAYHPKHLSNTYYFYRRGWCGINIDAMPGSMELFRQMRTRDINIEAAIAIDNLERSFYIFNGRALNTLDVQLAAQRTNGEIHVVETRKVKTRRLDDILTEWLPAGRQIQFMSIDVEGFDLEVLKSNNWSLFRPELILVEAWDLDLTKSETHPLVKYLAQQNYALTGKAYSTAFFKDNLYGLATAQ